MNICASRAAMLYRTLGKTKLKVSAVGIETHQWSGMGGKLFTAKEIRSFLDRALFHGINFIDTGECYFFHAAERLIGEALQADRKKFIIATKFGHQSMPGEIKSAWDESSIRSSLERSLKALQTKYIDLFQIHLNSETDIKEMLKHAEEIVRSLRAAKKAGVIRHIGIVLGDNALLDKKARAVSFAVRHFGVESVQAVYSRLDREAEKHIFLLAKRHRLGVIVRAPLSKGYLSSRFKPNNKNYDAKKMRLVEQIKKSELPEGADLAEWSIGWVLKNPLVSTVAPGCTSLEQLDSTARSVLL